jgi:cell division protein FtsI/penicillin-binding protein 2
VTGPRTLALAFVAIAFVAAPAAGQVLAPGAPAPQVTLTLDEAVQRALDRNLDIAVERLAPQALDFSLAALRANFLPT